MEFKLSAEHLETPKLSQC